MKSKILVVKDEKDDTKTVCWLGDDKFSEDIKHFDPEDPKDFDLASLDGTVSRYFEMEDLTEENDLLGKLIDDIEIKEITFTHEIQ